MSMLYNSRTYTMTVDALVRAGRLLPAGDLKREPDDTPTLQTVSLVWALAAGYWRQYRVTQTRVRNDTQWVCLDVIYGVRWFRQSQIDLWKREHDKREVKAA